MTRMIGKCKQSGVLLGCVFQRRMCNMARHAKKAIDDNMLGRIILADAALKYYRSQEYYDSDSWRGTWGLDGGGALMNQGVHGIDLLQWLAGGVQSVYAYCDTKVRSIEAEDTAVALLKFRSGAFGVIEGTTSVYPGNETVLSVYGDKGTISFGDNEFYAWNLAGSSDAPPDVTISMGGKNCSWENDNIGHALIIEDMADAVRNNRQPFIPGEEARKAVDIILSIYESSRTGKEAFINDTSYSG
jgi:UDP-N-acetyl-2-amino-2-deoxyglucuronate dehydrogenase